MLGTQRATVSAALRQFARAGVIKYRWGGMTILDRAGLQAVGCDCYHRVKAETERLIVGS